MKRPSAACLIVAFGLGVAGGVARADAQVQTRQRVGGSTASAQYPVNVDRWAVIIGVSDYANMSLSLQYADDDARALYHLIQTPSAGGFSEENILLLTNEEATTANVTRALRSFLKRPAREDIVFIYFAGHGAPDPDRPDNLYLLTHDTDPSDIAGTALPMRELQLSITENLLAERVVVMADACHSAGVTLGRRSAFDPAEIVNSYLTRVADSKPGMALLTSAEANQTAREGAEWGDDDYPGHGVFTYYVLEAMKGRADGHPNGVRDGVVTVGEVFEFVRDGVRQATDDQQHPSIGSGVYDRGLPMAITAGIAADDHLRLGEGLLDLAWMTTDDVAFTLAQHQFAEAIRLSVDARSRFAEAHVGLATAMIGARDYVGAAEYLVERFDPIDDAPTQVLRLAALGFGAAGDDARAAPLVRALLDRGGEPESAFMASYLRDIEKRSRDTGRRRALVVGINEHVEDWPDLSGSVADVQLIASVLPDLGIDPADTRVLTDSDATRFKFLQTIDSLRAEMSSSDVLLLHYSGYGIQPGSSDQTSALILHDTRDPGADPDPFTGAELAALLGSLPGPVVMILDGRISEEFVQASGEAGIVVLAAADPTVLPREARDESTGRMHGAWTLALVEALRVLGPEFTPRQLIDAGRLRTRELTGGAQEPFLVDQNRDSPLFALSPAQRYHDLFVMLLAERTVQPTAATLLRQRRWITENLGAAPTLLTRIGVELRSRGAFHDAIATFQMAHEAASASGTELDPEVRLELAAATAMARDYIGSAQQLRRLVESDSFSDGRNAVLDGLAERLETLASGRKSALLVGIDRYRTSLDEQPREGAINDVRAMERMLIDQYGLLPRDVMVLTDSAATRSAILGAVGSIASEAREHPAIFYFAGTGSRSAQGLGLTLVPWDGRSEGVEDVTIEQLRGIVGPDSTNLVVILDTFGGSRLTGPDRAPDALGGNSSMRDVDLSVPNIGRLTIVPGDAETQVFRGEGRSGGGEWLYGGVVHGRLTHGLVERLALADPGDSLGDVLESVVRGAPDQGVADPGSLDYEVLGDDGLPLFAAGWWTLEWVNNAIGESRARERLEEVVPLLRRLIEQRNGVEPDAHVALGIAHSLMGDHESAIQSYQTAINQGAGASAHVSLGLTLLYSRIDLERAVSEIRTATELRPDYVPAYLFLGQALQALMDGETRAEARAAFARYTAGGAPLGPAPNVN